jgi:hypothetical protein
MEMRLPTCKEMQDLVAFLPRLYAEGFEPVVQWHGGKQGEDGIFRLPYPEYDPLVHEFFGQVTSGGWLDYGYNPEEAARMLSNEEFVKSASLPQIKSMLTYCVRGERFSDGHWAEMIENGSIRRLLERINQLNVQ